ncbi:glycosyltransferase family 2 protein [Pararhodospirillum oryzae]|uniref:Glycosyl transferase n=1 Tax=Pararhodospirillum oryzae TaxID=478448 RepID=A0A512H6K7_9PROT|nr:glycosyltransferase [Pararhodospirillum oryzae]GEO81058.1 glycosyl transferase [Pararhodospirillum oryzae]
MPVPCSAPYPTAQDRAVLAAQPFDHNAAFANTQLDSLCARLSLERAQGQEGVLAPRHGAPWRLGVVIAGADTLAEGFGATWDSLRVQSLPPAAVALVAADPAAVLSLRIWQETRRPVAPWGKAAVIEDRLAPWLAGERLDLVVVLRAGDAVHPGLLCALARQSLAPAEGDQAPDLMVWNHLLIRTDEQNAREHTEIAYIRAAHPRSHPLALGHGQTTGSQLAITPALLATFPDDPAPLLAAGDIAALALWAARHARWGERLGEFLGACRVASFERALRPVSPLGRAIVRAALETPLLTTRPLVGDDPEAGVCQTPRRRAASIDVVICFRDGADDTLACLDSLARQRTQARVRVILVANQSSAETRARLHAALPALGDAGLATRWLDYDAPFNHSDQINHALALRDDDPPGEAVLILSNDCVLLDGDTLDELAAWALVPGIGAVGPRLVDETGRLTGGAIEGLFLGQDLYPPITETFDCLHAPLIREVMAVAFSCAALARATWEHIPPLDAVHFPVGLNDVDYCLRLEAAGFVQVALGPWRARHRPHGSRAHVDDNAQIARLRTRYPHLWTARERYPGNDFLRQIAVMQARRTALGER